MERLTYGLGSYNRTYGLVDKASAKPGLFTDYDGFYANLLAHHRLGQYEDILFDADGKELVSVEHLTELVKAMEEGRRWSLPKNWCGVSMCWKRLRAMYGATRL